MSALVLMTLVCAASPFDAPGAHLLTPEERTIDTTMTRRDRIERLSWEASTIDTSWPSSAFAMTLVGASFGPSFTLIGGLLLGVAAAAVPAFLLPAILILVVGAAGDAVVVIGVVQGQRVAGEQRQRREALLRQRDELMQGGVSLPF